MRGGVFAPSCRGRGPRARDGRAVDDGPRPRPRGHPAEPVVLDGGDGPARGRHRHRHQVLDRAQPPRARRAPGAAARAPRRRARCSRAIRTPSSSPTGPATRRRSTTSSRPCAAWSGRCRSGASASATSCSAGRSGSRPSSCRSATAAPTTRSRTSGRAGSRSPRRTTASRCSARAASATIDADEPVRWETDFGTAELQQLNLYDRTVEGLVLRDVPGSTVQYHPEAGPGPHDSLHLFDRFLELAPPDAAPRRHPQDPRPRLRARS